MYNIINEYILINVKIIRLIVGLINIKLINNIFIEFLSIYLIRRQLAINIMLWS